MGKTTKSFKVRLAYTDNYMVTFTPRGGRRILYHREPNPIGQRGFIRLNGKVVSGFLGFDKQFYPAGINMNLVDEVVGSQIVARRKAKQTVVKQELDDWSL